MNISYKWLKSYLKVDITPDQVAKQLTSIGLEVGSMHEVESIKGGLKGLVIGLVKTCVPHPNSDHLSLTTVDLGDGIDTPIVCGAKNVAAGQKVVVATIGTILYNGDESFEIKKSKIRGETSMGMICAEDEIGIGTSHEGIIVLPADAKVGTPAAEYYNIENDTVLEVDLTPNRIDAGSHVGIARDLAASLKLTNPSAHFVWPDVSAFKVDDNAMNIQVSVVNSEACPRYAGLCISDVKVADSPDWLKNKLKAIGLNPINNVVDVTNFVLHEVGQPLHAFDADKISGQKVVVKTLAENTPFVTLDGIERKLGQNDLMICNATEGMCIAGVFGGAKSGVTESTKQIFLESAYFNPVSVRKTARRHGLSTDASFRFERGIDPNVTLLALKRAALLIKEVAGGKISSNITDIYPQPIADFKVNLRYAQVNRLIGQVIPLQTVKSILAALEIKIEHETDEALQLLVPPYRVDVKREADVIEEILRIYGYNTVPILSQVNSTLSYVEKPDPNQLRNIIANRLSGIGFNEMMANSLTSSEYYSGLTDLSEANLVKIVNPLSQDLNCMRQTLLFGALETMAFNSNRQNNSLKLFEFGNCYALKATQSEKVLDKYFETERLALSITGNRNPEMWNSPSEQVSFFYLKSNVENIFERLGLKVEGLNVEAISDELYSEALVYTQNNQLVAKAGMVNAKLLRKFDIKQPVYFAEIEWSVLRKLIRKNKVQYAELSKYPEVRRDLALLLDKNIAFNDIKKSAIKIERKLLKKVSLFDVYEGEKLGKDKKSYAISFILQDDEKTLADKQIEKVMQNLIKGFEQEFKAQIR